MVAVSVEAEAVTVILVQTDPKTRVREIPLGFGNQNQLSFSGIDPRKTQLTGVSSVLLHVFWISAQQIANVQ